MYTIFIRNWYKPVKTPHPYMKGKFITNYVPDPTARRTVLTTASNQDEARRICQEYNQKHNPGPKQRKAEYTSNF